MRTSLARFHGRDGDLPAAGAGGRIADDDVPCSAHQGPGDALFLEHVEGGLRGITLGDPADVELHPGLRELNGPGLRVEHHLVGADQGPGFGEPRGVGQLVVAASPAPQAARPGRS